MNQPPSLNQPLTDLLKNAGTDLVGFADLTPLPDDVRAGLTFGVAIAVRLDPEIVRSLVDGPTAEYAAEYDRLNEKLGDLADTAAAFLRDRGYRAIAGAATATKEELDLATLSTPLPHKTVARLAGLGWIGKCALLITPEFGSAIRLNSVLTDAPLETGTPVDESRCGTCERCVQVCPVSAPTGETWTPGSGREDIYDVRACFEETLRGPAGAGLPRKYILCGRCIAVCPYTWRSLASTGTRAEQKSDEQ